MPFLQRAAIFSIPTEIIEYILILSAAADDPRSIASLSQTCQHFYSLVHKNTDRYLWRSIFLTTFDDPRPGLDFLRDLHGDHPCLISDNFNWAGHYQERIKAQLVLGRTTRIFEEKSSQPHEYSPSLSSSNVSGAPVSPRLASIIKSFLSAIYTASFIKLSEMTTAFTELHTGVIHPPTHTEFLSAPSFPPLTTLLASSARTFIGSHNAQWLENVLKYGYPLELTRLLFARLKVDANADGVASFTDGKTNMKPLLTSASHCKNNPLAMLFHKLICFTGFIPIRPREDDVDAHFNYSLPSAEEQFADVRCLARRRVYDSQYLRKERAWGPFLPITRRSSVGSAAPLLRWDESSNLPGNRQNLQLADDAQPGGRQTGQVHIEDSYNDDLDELSDPTIIYSTESSEDEPILTGTHFFTRYSSTQQSPLVPPIAPAELRADWVWLASARIVAEANLKEMLRWRSIARVDDNQGEEGDAAEIFSALRRLEGLRMGGAPGYWDKWETGKTRSQDMTQMKSMGQTRGGNTGMQVSPIDDAVEGWDWAGCEGAWKRCVCWLDHRDLLTYNSDYNRFYNPIHEYSRLVPMTLHITGYSQPPPPPFGLPAWAKSGCYRNRRQLPVIHVEGYTAGPVTSPNDIRTVEGTVSIIGDGAIRWSLVSTPSAAAAGPTELEWQLEAVQIGNPGSASGLVGMWTSAQHRPSHPLGAVWMWKVT